jgi:hypothetical protein
MRTYTIFAGLLGALLIGIGMSRAASTAWAGSSAVAGCFDCQNGGSCNPGYHKDDDGEQLYQGPNPKHSGCSEYSCDAEHYYYAESHDFALSSVGERVKFRPQDIKEVRVLVGRVLRAVHDGDVTEIADLTRNDARVRINMARGAVQVNLGGNVVAHAVLSADIVAKVLAHH